MCPMNPYYISVTGIQVPALKVPKFAWYTVPAISQAKCSSGNVFTKVTKRGSVYYTLTVWETRQDMLRFLRNGPHAKAMKEERSVGIFAQTYGYESTNIPDWEEALKILKEKGRVHFDWREKNLSSSKNRIAFNSFLPVGVVLAFVGYAAAKFMFETKDKGMVTGTSIL